MSAGSSGADSASKRTTIFCELNCRKKVDCNGTKVSGTCRFLPQRPEISPVKYIKNLGDKMISVVRYIASRKRTSTKVTSSVTVPKQPTVAPIDSQRAEAINDCIEFINSSSSSSLTRSKSVSC